jgi:hypothetical protein
MASYGHSRCERGKRSRSIVSHNSSISAAFSSSVRSRVIGAITCLSRASGVFWTLPGLRGPLIASKAFEDLRHRLVAFDDRGDACHGMGEVDSQSDQSKRWRKRRCPLDAWGKTDPDCLPNIPAKRSQLRPALGEYAAR